VAINFGALLAPVLADLTPDVRPAFLARLERTAAERYRMWAAALPDWADELLTGAAAEDEIADRIIAAFPITSEQAEMLDARLPQARSIYYETFDGLSVIEQLQLQAGAERQGANAWRSVAQTPGLSDHVLGELAACSKLEEASADLLDELLRRASVTTSNE
jgi:hypothetical protein